MNKRLSSFISKVRSSISSNKDRPETQDSGPSQASPISEESEVDIKMAVAERSRPSLVQTLRDVTRELQASKLSNDSYIETPELKEIVPLLESCLDVTKVISLTTGNLTNIGDNFGSILSRLSVRVLDKKCEEQTIELVAKSPPTNELLHELAPDATVQKENGFYRDVVPSLLEIQEASKVPIDRILDIFPKYYTGRTSLDPNSKLITADAMIILENLSSRGYKTIARGNSFNFEQAKMVLEKLATFHGLGIALRLHRPDIFDSVVRPLLKPFKTTTDNDVEFEDMSKELDAVDGITELTKFRIYKEFADYKQACILTQVDDVQLTADTPFTTILHADLWTNNIMFQEDDAGSMLDVKFLDFQRIAYGSLVYDIVFFLFTSVQRSVLENKFTELLKHYHNNFFSIAGDMGLPLGEYTYDLFWMEFMRNAHKEIIHILTMTKIVMADYSDMVEMKDDSQMELGYKIPPSEIEYNNRMKTIITVYNEHNLLVV